MRRRDIKVYAGIATLVFARESSAKEKNYNGHIEDRTYYLACARRGRLRCTNHGLKIGCKYTALTTKLLTYYDLSTYMYLCLHGCCAPSPLLTAVIFAVLITHSAFCCPVTAKNKARLLAAGTTVDTAARSLAMLQRVAASRLATTGCHCRHHKRDFSHRDPTYAPHCDLIWQS